MAGSIVKLTCIQGIDDVVYGDGLFTLTMPALDKLEAAAVQVEKDLKDKWALCDATLGGGKWAKTNAPHSPPPPAPNNKMSVTVNPAKVLKYESGLLYTTSHQIVPYFSFDGSPPKDVSKLFDRLNEVMKKYSELTDVSFQLFNILSGAGVLVGSTLAIPVDYEALKAQLAAQNAQNAKGA